MGDLILLNPKDIYTNGDWLFWKEEPSPSFIDSIKSFGLLSPVLVSLKRDGYWLVSGYKRIKACEYLDIKVEAKTVTGDIVEFGLIYFYSNLSPYIPPERLIIALNFFKDYMNHQRLMTFLEDLTDFFDSRLIHNLKLLVKLNDWYDIFRKGNLNLELVKILNRFDYEDLNCLKSFFKNIKWSYGSAKRFLQYVWELKRIKKTNLENIFKESGILEVFGQDLSPKDKIDRILSKFKRFRFPLLLSLEEEFQRIKKGIEKDSIWRIEPEEGFETNKIHIKAEIGSFEDLKKSVTQLQFIADSSFFKQLKSWQDKRLGLKDEEDVENDKKDNNR